MIDVSPGFVQEYQAQRTYEALKGLLNLGSTLFGTDITRRFGELLKGTGAQVIGDESSLMNGTYRVILARIGAQSV